MTKSSDKSSTRSEDAPQASSLRSNVQWTLVSYVAYGACQWLMLIVVARFGLPEMVGQFALSMAVTTPIILLIGLDLRAIQVTDQSNQYKFEDFLSLRIVTLCIAMVIIVVVSSCCGHSQEKLLLIFAMGLAKCIEAISDLCHGTLQQHEQFFQMAKARIARGVVGVLALAAGLYFFHSLLLATMMIVLMWTIVLVCYDWPLTHEILLANRRSVRLWRFHDKALSRLLVVAIPTGILSCQASLEQSLPRLCVDHYLGERELGIYSAVSSLTIAAMMVVNAVHAAVVPRIAKMIVNCQLNPTWKLLLQLCLFGIVLGGIGIAGAAIFGDRLLGITFGSEYASQRLVLVVLMVGATIRYATLPLAVGFRAAQYFWLLVTLQTIAMVAAVPVLMILIQRYGGLGAAYASVALSISFAIFQVPATLWYFRSKTLALKSGEGDVGPGFQKGLRGVA